MAKKDKPEEENQPANDELEVIVEPEQQEEEVVVADASSAGPDDWKAQLEAAQKKAEEAEAARAEAERIARERAEQIARYETESTRAKSQAASAEMLAIDNAIANTEHEKAEAKAKLKAAYESGDFDAVAEAQAQLSDVAVKAQRLKEGKAAIERSIDAAKQSADPVEQYVSQLTPQSAAWIRAHPEVVRDQSKREKLERAHYKALGEGIRPDTSEYFAHMDREMGYSVPETPVEHVEPKASSQRTQSAPAAPVSRGGSADVPEARRNVVRLTAAQREIAAMCGMTDAEYAKHLLAIERERATTH